MKIQYLYRLIKYSILKNLNILYLHTNLKLKYLLYNNNINII